MIKFHAPYQLSTITNDLKAPLPREAKQENKQQ